MLSKLRDNYHKRLCKRIIRIRRSKNIEYPNFSDVSSKTSKAVAWKIVEALNCKKNYESISGQTAGILFEQQTMEYLQKAFGEINHLRPGEWNYGVNNLITAFEQFKHLDYIKK